MSIRAQIRNAGFPTSLVSFRNTPQGTLASFPAMGQTHGWYEDIPLDKVIPIMEWTSWVEPSEEDDEEYDDEE